MAGQRRWLPSAIPGNRPFLIGLWVLGFALVFLWQRGSVVGRGPRMFSWAAPPRPLPKLRPLAFNLTDFGGVGDGVTLNTEAFERAVAFISKLRKKGGGQLNVQAGVWLTAPFNLTSHMTLFLAEGAVILGIQVKKILLLFVMFVRC